MTWCGRSRRNRRKRGVSIWDVEFQKEGGEYYLRVYIDRVPDGVTSDDCENMASQLNPLLDEADPIDHSTSSR